VHPSWVDFAQGYDIALLQLSEEILADDLHYAVLPNLGFWPNDGALPIQYGYAIGYGATYAGGSQASEPRKLYTELYTDHQCLDNAISLDHDMPGYSLATTAGCAGAMFWSDIDTCQGDSGGPLYAKYETKDVILGITSWGYSCGLAHYPGVYEKVEHHAAWVNTTITGNEANPGALRGFPAFATFDASNYHVDNPCACRADACVQEGDADVAFCYVERGQECAMSHPSTTTFAHRWRECEPNQVSAAAAPEDHTHLADHATTDHSHETETSMSATAGIVVGSVSFVMVFAIYVKANVASLHGLSYIPV
jgi:hypothetical protein